MIPPEQIDYWAQEIRRVQPGALRNYIANIVRDVERDVATDVNGFLFERYRHRSFGRRPQSSEMDSSQQPEKQ